MVYGTVAVDDGQMKAAPLCFHPGGGQSSRHDLTGRLPVEEIAGDAGGEGGDICGVCGRPGEERMHGNMQNIALLHLRFRHPRGRAFIRKNTY